MTGAALLLWWAGQTAIASDSACPSAQAVRERLERLVGPDGAPSARVAVTTDPAGIGLALRDGAGALVAERVVVAGADCDERAGAAAAVVAAWIAEVPALRLPAPELDPPVVVAAPLALEVGAGPLALIERAPRFGGRLEAEIARRNGAWAGRVETTLTSETTADVAGGSARWRRTSFGLGAVVRPIRGAVRVSLDATALGTVVSVRGRGFDVDTTDAGWAAGVAAGGRVGVSLGRTALWLDVRALHWPGVQRVLVQQPGGAPRTEVELSRTEGHVTVGISVRAL